MSSTIKLDKNKLHIFHEGRKRRMFVATLIYVESEDIFKLIYDKKYVYSKNAISMGPNLSLFSLTHESKKGTLFPTLSDRIPDRDNPAYVDYCKMQGISVDETNPIVLLGSIGRRGPSSFIFEPVYVDAFSPADIVNMREELDITQHDFALAFDLSKATLQRIESEKSTDKHLLKQIQIFLSFPEVALWQLKLTGGRVHRKTLVKLVKYFRNQS